MHLTKFTCQVEHRPGKELVIADALSRNSTRTNGTVEDQTAEEEAEAFDEHVQASWPVHKDKLEYIRQAVM